MKIKLQVLESFIGRISSGNLQLTIGQVLKVPYEKADVLLKTGKFMLLPWDMVQRASESLPAWLDKLSNSEKDIYTARIKYMKFDGGLSTDEFRIGTVKQIIKDRVIKGKCDSCARVEGCLLTSGMRKGCRGPFNG